MTAVQAGPAEHTLAEAAEAQGEQLINSTEYNQAIKALDKAISLDPKYALAYTFRAFAYLKLGNFTQAINDSTTAIRLNPKFWTPYRWRSEAYEKQGQVQKAIDQMTSAISVDAKNFSAYIARGDLYARHGMYQRAVDDYSKAIELDPLHRDATVPWKADPTLPWGYVFFARSLAYHKLGMNNLAIKDLKQAKVLGYKP